MREASFKRARQLEVSETKRDTKRIMRSDGKRENVLGWDMVRVCKDSSNISRPTL